MRPEYAYATFNLENISLSFQSPSDDTSRSPFVSFQCLVGAQEAAEKVVSETTALKELLGSYHVSPQDYFVQAGFNEDLLARGTGHLQEIYIYLSKEVRMQDLSSMIDGVGSLFHPFPCVLLTAENSYRTPPPPELPFGVDSIILEQGDRKYQIMRLSNHLDEPGSLGPKSNGGSAPQEHGDGGGSSGRQNGGSVGGGVSGGGEGSGSQGNNKETFPNKRSEGFGGGGNDGHGNPPNDGDDNEPEDKEIGSNGIGAQTVTGTPEVVCNSHIQVYLPKVATSSKLSTTESPPKQEDTLFQEFNMRVVVAIDVSPSLPG